MKETVFRFSVRVASPEPTVAIHSLRNTLLGVKGVQQIDADGPEQLVELRVFVTFTDADEAKRLHRRLMNLIQKCNGVMILEVTTTLTDIFE